MIAGIGIDLVEVAQFEKSLTREGKALLDRIFHPGEQEYCSKMPRPVVHFAARLAAKEAAAKAFGAPVRGQLNWLDFEVRRKLSGEPFLQLHGAAAALAKRRGIEESFLSLSHSEQYATAQVLLTARG